MQSITDRTDLKGVRVFVRSSLDVPIKDGVVVNDFRVIRALPTIQYLLDQGARVIIATHVGRDPQNSTLPVAGALKKHISVTHVPGVIGGEVTAAVETLKDGQALLLENLRRHPEEEANDATFAATLASYADIFVNDAFAVSHRPHASIVGVASLLPSYAGTTFFEEYNELLRACTPAHPSLFIIGGAKFDTKSPLIEKFLPLYEHTFIGGALAHDFLKARGYEIGTSVWSEASLEGNPLIFDPRILLPLDVVVSNGTTKRVVEVSDVRPDEKILDLGPATAAMLAGYITPAQSILWNGTLGYYEGGYDEGTKSVAELIAHSDAFSVVGGGDTIASIESLGIDDRFGFLSTAGGAMLEFLEAGTLPGIDALANA